MKKEDSGTRKERAWKRDIMAIIGCCAPGEPLARSGGFLHSPLKGADCRNVEICDFTLADGAGMNWRHSRRIHTHHATLKNISGCGIDYQLNVHGSVLSDLHVENTGWHGVALHDHTVGKYPLYNNIIRDCRLYNAKHNEVDLHSGAFSTIVENCDMKGPLQAIYFHNLGAGLIARNNTIREEHRGMWAGPIEGQFIMKAYFIDNRIYSVQRDCAAWSPGKAKGGTLVKDVAFIGNTFTDCTRDKGYRNLAVRNAENALLSGNRFINPVQPGEPWITIENCTGEVIVEDVADPAKVKAVGTKVKFFEGSANRDALLSVLGKGVPQKADREVKR